MTDTTDDQYKRIVKRLFILRQFFCLWLLNEIYEVFENVVNHARTLDRYRARALDQDLIRAAALDLDRAAALNLDRAAVLDQDLARTLALDLYLARTFALDLDQALVRARTLALNLVRYLVKDLDQDFDLHLYRYLDLYLDRYLDRYLDQDFYKYIDADLYRSVSSQSRNRFDKQLQKQITFVNDMEKMKIFKQVDLQRMVQRFNEQREFIKAAAEGKSVEPPVDSIHDTWLSVLGITDEMLAIPRETLEAYVTYLEAVELIVACKEAAGRVSPEVWQQIEDRFLTADAADIKN